MPIAFVDPIAGISGDMIIAAFIDAGLSVPRLRKELKKLNLDNFQIRASKVKRSAISATKFDVELKGKITKLRRLEDIQKIIKKSTLSDYIKTNATDIFIKLAQAESTVHGISMEKVHFHEIGAVDTIIDIVSATIGMEFFEIDELISSALNVGSGSITIEHGKFAVPAPASALLLQGKPTYSDGTLKELVTPTGAAILTHYATEFSFQPLMETSHIGYGAGLYDLESVGNVLRILIGNRLYSQEADRVVELVANIDNMNPERYGYIFDKLFEAGSLDVVLIPCIMKKGRPAVILKVLAAPSDTAKLEKIIFTETTTIGIRRYYVDRSLLKRKIVTLKTEHGVVRFKEVSLDGNKIRSLPEHEDIVKISKRAEISYADAYELALKEKERV
ncbi:MAG: nickel pincer cofactor biosynthesis protein LarC [Nitrospinota bacterium]